MNPMDTVYWLGNDERFDQMVAANEACPEEAFNMHTWGREEKDPRRIPQCGTVACLWGNYALQELGGKVEDLSPEATTPEWSIAAHLNIPLPEEYWLFSARRYSPQECQVVISMDMDRGLSRSKDSRKGPNLARLKKYLAWKRRKRERIELDLAMQEADRRLIRQGRKHDPHRESQRDALHL